jgi:hypothetical protein|nr:MAG TPA: zinc-ribbon domain protein [Caudoviricetes sp.]
MPKRNRLQLDFSLPTAEERQVFLTEYLEALPFTPTSSELELMADYVLWGDKNAPQGEAIELETYWKKKEKKIESLEELKENPAFLETRLASPLASPKTVKTRRVFSREEARALASPYVLAQLEPLWREIDTLDLETRFYENRIGRQTKPPREALLGRFTPSQIEEIREHAQQLTEYAYLKKRKLLVEKRTEQYQWKDTYTPPLILRHAPETANEPSPPPALSADIPVFPLNISTPITPKIFPESGNFPAPDDFTEKELRALSQILWAPTPSSKVYFDFRDPSHLYALTHLYSEIWDDPAQSTASSTLRDFFSAFFYYRNLTELSPIYDELLSLKMAHYSNAQISQLLNKKYGRTYGENYISTIYRKKILPKIAETVRAHQEVCAELFFPENFKKCKDCGKTLLRNTNNFIRKTKSADGFSPRCKHCEKILRDKRRN